MPTYKTSQEWLQQSSLLLEARPSTTRITTRYHIKDPSRKRKSAKAKSEAADTATATTTSERPPKPPRGHLELRTFDPVSGAMLRYRTSKAAEVAHLVQMLGTLGRRMAALPPQQQHESDVPMPDAPGTATAPAAATSGDGGRGSGTQTPVAGGAGSGPAPPQQQQQQQGGGKGKKKKGKR